MDIPEPYSAADAEFKLQTLDIQDPFPQPAGGQVNPRKRHRFPSPVDIKEVGLPSNNYAYVVHVHRLAVTFYVHEMYFFLSHACSLKFWSHS